MKRGEQIRKHDLRRYVLYRIKLMEWLQVFLLWLGCDDGSVNPTNVLGHGGEDFKNTLRTILLSWMCTIVDAHRDGLNVFPLWLRLYPRHKKRIRTVRDEVEPQLQALRDFRDRVGFHADTPDKYFAAKSALIGNGEVIRAAVMFHDLITFLMHREPEELPDFFSAVEELLLDLESVHKISINREWFKKMAILPRENYRRVF